MMDKDGKVKDRGKGGGGINTGLFALSDDALLTENALAGVLGFTDRTVRRMVRRGELPPPFLFGGKRNWFARDVKAWIERAADEAIKMSEKQHQERKVNSRRLVAAGLV